jgi:hypothetical protein
MIYTIKESEIIGYVYDIYGSKFLDILELLKNHCEQNGIPLLNNCNKDCPGEFVEIIADCLDMKNIFLQKNNLDKQNKNI